MDMAVVRREYTDIDTGGLVRALVFYSYTRSGGVLHRNTLRFGRDGRIEALDVVRLASRIGKHYLMH